MVTPRFARLALVCLALLCITALSASASRIYTTAASDGDVVYESAHGDYGAVSYALDYNPFARVMYSYSTWLSNHYGVFQFPLASLRGTTLPQDSVKLHVYCSDTMLSSGSLQLSGFNFDAGGATNWYLYNGSKTSLAFVGVTDRAWSVVDVTADLQRQINAGYSWAGYYFSLDYQDNIHPYSNTTDLATYEDSAHRPYLEVTPEPSSLLALGGGLVGLLGLVRRKAK